MLYFLPGNQSPDKSQIAKFGLEYAFEDLPLDVGQVRTNQGPESYSGFVVSCSGTPPEYSPLNQVWFKHPLGSWFGWNKSNPPKPSMLQRQEMFSGKLVHLVNDNLWQIPIAHSWVLESGNLRCIEQFTRTLEFFDGAWEPGQIVLALTSG